MTPGARGRARHLRPWIVGPLLMLALFVVELAAASQLGAMGLHDDATAQTLVHRYARAIAWAQLGIAGVYLLVGALLGGIAEVGLALWDRARGVAISRRWPRWLAVAVLVAALHGWRLALTVARYPQLFVETLHAHGGWRRALQVALTHHVPRPAVEIAGWLALAALLLAPAATARGRRWLASRLGALGRARRVVAAVSAVAVTATVLAAWRGATGTYRAAAADAPPSILILAVDSLRADRVGPGHEAVSPHLSSLASRGTHYTAAHVTVPRTFPSWTTLLTGRWPQRHNIRTMFPGAAERAAIGPALPSLLAARGYSTAVVSDFAGEIFSRIDVGFADRRVPYFGLGTIVEQVGINLHPGLLPVAATRLGHRLWPALETNAESCDPDRLADRVIEAVDDHARRGPFFITAFFSTVHFPYAAPDPYYRRHTDPGYSGRFRYHKPVPSLDEPDVGLTAADLAQVRHLYDGAVTATDDAVGRVLEALERRGLAERTIIVVLADHGENLYDAGRGMGHGEHLHGDAALHIPLIIYDPTHKEAARRRVAALVRDVDVAPTLAALAGARLDGADGMDLAPLARGEKPDLGLHAFAETGLWFTHEGPGFGPAERIDYPAVPASLTVEGADDIVLQPSLRRLVVAAKHRSLRTDRWKLYYTPTRAGVRWTLHDLAADPDERTDVATQHAEVLRGLQAELYRWMTLDGSTIANGFVVPPP